VNGESWKMQRNLAKTVFSVDTRTSMFDTYCECAEKLCNLLDQAVLSKEVIDIQYYFKRFTLDTFCIIGFGIDINSLEHPIPFSTVFDLLFEETEKRAIDPTRKFWNQKVWVEYLQIFNDFINGIIEKRRLANDHHNKTDFLSTLLQHEGENKEVLTPSFLRDQVANFLVAGRDTTAMLCAWVIYFLSKNPDMEKRVREEVDAVIGDEKPSLILSKKLKYMQMVLDEALRLSPPAVPLNIKCASKDDVLPNGLRLKKGDHVCVIPPVIHRLESIWGPDALEFNPDRWEKSSTFHPFQFIPFQKGPRVCLGQNMAYEEAKCLLSILFRKGYKFENFNTSISVHISAIYQAQEGLLMKVSKI